MVGDYKDRYILIDVEESHEKIDVDLEAIGLKEDGLKQVEEKKIGRKPIQKTVLAEPIGFLFHEENDGYRLRTAPEPQKKRPHVGDTLEIEVNVHTTIASPDPHARKPRVPVHEIQDFKIVEGDRVIDEDKKEVILNTLYNEFKYLFEKEGIEKNHLDAFLENRELYREGIYDRIDKDMNIERRHYVKHDFTEAFVKNYIIPNSIHRDVKRAKRMGEKIGR